MLNSIYRLSKILMKRSESIITMAPRGCHTDAVRIKLVMRFKIPSTCKPAKVYSCVFVTGIVCEDEFGRAVAFASRSGNYRVTRQVLFAVDLHARLAGHILRTILTSRI